WCTSDCTGEEQVEFTEASHATYLEWYKSHSVTQIRPLHPHQALLREKLTEERKRSFRLAQLIVPFFESITEQVIPEDLLAVHSEIVRAGEAGSDADVSEDMHCDESVSGVQEGSNDMSSESDPFLAPTYETEDIADDIEVNEQGERINVVNEPVNVPSPVNVRLLDENMPLTTTLSASRGGNSSSPVDNIITSVHAECDVPAKKRSETIEQAAPISVDEAAGSTGCHPQSPPLVVTTVESTGDCGMDVGPVKKKPNMDKQREIQAIKAGLPNKTCLRRRPGHSSLDVTPGATLPLISTTMVIFGIRSEPVPEKAGGSDAGLQRM
ncbi:hypothetical protein IFM89_000445, partial [Coptis chinensis]